MIFPLLLFLSESEILTPFPENSPLAKSKPLREFLSAKGEFPFSRGILSKGVKTSLSDKNKSGGNTVYYGKFCFKIYQHL